CCPKPFIGFTQLKNGGNFVFSELILNKQAISVDFRCSRRLLPEANRTLVTKALPHDVALLAFVPREQMRHPYDA
ncbi:hypothetical protein, partial [Psychrobacillus soli]|uniref:hypothetical protein n=1 Tax=Psychrobacillus soli TaxID=1543965 RepID=UPI001C8E6002